ncbi:C-Jun-amino-terminal kinase-interacting protein 1-like [Dunckerocampus dactyliophorus]|uniref:C-Jun-amino-terminal kinase-interacting protein 1-like n=1 Tax=Dunckerocampus dactyliophorus TaxID=161453 RepID=UPI0024073F24|nr:C-Jun-amino-terminal kinase-interacting protein 1-like [Dunckerocampus dactyliophorus]XP_054633518.1 C-Jun-amino-terminal kinase-interacting protein 1-like [Dunckerocampus dactyliophorus]
MDKYRPKRPTTLALMPQRAQAGTQDTINNNSLGKKDSWKDSRSSSPHITGDRTQPDSQPKAEDKVRPCTRRPAPKAPTSNGSNSRASSQAAAGGTHVRPREREPTGATHTQSFSTPSSQRRGGAVGGGRGRGGGRGAGAMRERNLGEIRGKDGVTSGKEERRGGRLCDESKGKEKERTLNHRAKETNRLKSSGADGKGKLCAKGENKGGRGKLNHSLSNQVYLTAMVVPRTPVAPRKEDKTKVQGQNHDRKSSQSNSEGGSNRMSISSDTEGPPPEPLHPPLSHRANPDIREEEGEGALSSTGKAHDSPESFLEGETKSEIDCPPSEAEPRQGKGDDKSESTESTKSICTSDPLAPQTIPKSEASALLNYDSVKYTMVVDEHAQLELVSLKDCLHSKSGHKEDSDTETVYQSANEEEDPEYKEERKRKEEAKKQEWRKEEEMRRKEEEKKMKEDLKRRRDEEVKRRREVVARVCKHPKAIPAKTSEEEESNGGKASAPRSKKFLNLFSTDSDYSSTGAGSFSMFSCVLDGVERQQSHRAVYRFVPRHADELYLETDDPVLILKQSEDLWCQGYNMRTGATGIFPAFYAVRVSKNTNKGQKDGWIEQFLVRFLGSVQVPSHKGNDVLCAAMRKVAYNRRLAGQPPSACVLEVSVRGVKISVQDQCHSAHRGEQCFHFFHLKNISFCGCHPKHSKYFGFITKHPDQHRFACHVMMAETSLHPLAKSVGKAFQQYYKEHIGYSCPTEDIFIE